MLPIKIINRNSGKALEVSAGSLVRGGNVQQWDYKGYDNQVWWVEEHGQGKNSLINVKSGKALDVHDALKDNNANVHQWDFLGNDNQLWKFEHVEDGWFKIVSCHSNKVLDVLDASKENGANVQQYAYGRAKNQQWRIEVAQPERFLRLLATGNKTTESLNLDFSSQALVESAVGGFHAQAIAQYKNYIYIAFSDGERINTKLKTSSRGLLCIYNHTTKQSQLMKLPDGYSHPSCIQIVNQYMVVTVEAEYGTLQDFGIAGRDHQSRIIIYDISNPTQPREIKSLYQNSVNSGGAGLAFHPKTKRWYMLIDRDGENLKDIILVQSNNEHVTSFDDSLPVKASYSRVGSGAGHNLITAFDGSIWGLYFDTVTPPDNGLPNRSITGGYQMIPSADIVHLFKLVEPDGSIVTKRTIYKQIVSLGAPAVTKLGELLTSRPGMRFGTSLRSDETGIELILSQRNMSDSFLIERIPINTQMQTMTKVNFVNFASCNGEIYCGANNDRHSGHLAITRSWSTIMPSPVRGKVKYFSEKAAILSLGKWRDAIEKNSSAPLALFYLEGIADIDGHLAEFNTEVVKE